MQKNGNFKKLKYKRIKNATLGLLLAGLTLLVGCQSRDQARDSIRDQARDQSASRIVPLPAVHLPSVAEIQHPLLETRWQIVQIKGRPAQQYSAAPYLQLTAQGRVLGSTGCNTLSGEYSLGLADDLNLRSNATRQDCLGALAQEANLMDALDQVRHYDIQPQGLLLRDARRQVVLRAQVR